MGYDFGSAAANIAHDSEVESNLSTLLLITGELIVGILFIPSFVVADKSEKTRALMYPNHGSR